MRDASYGAQNGTQNPRSLEIPTLGTATSQEAPCRPSPLSFPSLLPPAMCSFIGRSITTCPHKIHPRKRTSKPLHTHDSMHRHTCIPMFRGKDPHSQPQVTPSPRPSASPHFTVKGSIWGTNTPPPHTEGVAWQQGKIYHHYPNIISKLDSGSS